MKENEFKTIKINLGKIETDEIKFVKKWAKKCGYIKRPSVEEIEDLITKGLDNIGLDLRVWKEDYFGRKPEKDLVKRLAYAISVGLGGV